MGSEMCIRDRAHSLAAEVLSIPVYPELTREMQDHVVAAVGEFLGADQTKEE